MGAGNDKDDYDWLWSSSDDRSAGAPAPSGTLSPPDLPPPDLPPPSGPQNPGRRPKKPRRTRGWLRLLLLLVVAWLTFLVAVPVVAWSQVARFDADPGGERPAAGPTRTFLLIGTDERPSDRARGRTDTILLLTWGNGPSVLTSIPRDSIVPIPGHGRTKINAAHAWGGPSLLVQTLEETTGVRIDGVVQVGFSGLVGVVDGVGGITICPERDLKDKDSHLDVKKGCQVVDGETALAYSRNRKSYPTGDVARGQAQREVIGAIGEAVRQPSTVLDPRRWAKTSMSTADSIGVSDNVSMLQFARFAWALSGAMSGSGLNCTVPLKDLAVTWDRTRALAYFEHLRRGTTAALGDLCSPSGLPTP